MKKIGIILLIGIFSSLSSNTSLSESYTGWKSRLFMKVYPNPANSYVSVTVLDSTEIRALNITNISGRRVPTTYSSTKRSVVSVITSNIPNGVYFLTCSSNFDTYTQTLVVIH